MRADRRVIVGLSAALLLASAVSTATARNFSISNQSMRATWTSLEFESGGIRTGSCRVTLEGSFHSRSIAKVAAGLVGSITRARLSSCELFALNGTEIRLGTAVPQTLPWQISYGSFVGALPNISILRLGIELRIGLDQGGVCLGEYGASGDNTTFNTGREATGALTSLVPNEFFHQLSLSRRNSGIFCPPALGLTGTGQPTVLGATTRLTVTLI